MRDFQNAWVLPGGAAGAKFTDAFIGQPVEFATLGVALDLAVESFRLEPLEPRTKFRKFVRRERRNSFFDVFDGHVRSIARGQADLKEQAYGVVAPASALGAPETGDAVGHTSNAICILPLT